ncbi:MAG: HEPN domain-containing protein [Desulfobacula sp.]|nr:HEPN domain-containing protein [Desulfobacula sp.]
MPKRVCEKVWRNPGHVINENIKYWIDSFDYDFQEMTHLFEKGDYTWSLFVGHLFLEKLLKAWYVKINPITVPKLCPSRSKISK